MLKSKRLTYRKFTSDQFDTYRLWYQNNEVMKFISGRALTNQETTARFDKVIANNNIHPSYGLFGVYHIVPNKLCGIGRLSLTEEPCLEIGYGIFPNIWGKGYGTEILECLLSFAKKNKDVDKIIAIADPNNLASIKMLTKAKFKFEKKWVDEQNLEAVQYFYEL